MEEVKRAVNCLSLDKSPGSDGLPRRSKSEFQRLFMTYKQSGFLKGRSIHNNIRLVLDLLEYNYMIEDGLILFLDF